ncbi:GxxExxY protein [Chloroflexus sp.]|uniref:GxxExxY protein n=1 Tax=Chloroflexus sp. TaxID=1904827 RepID=UPI002ACE4D4F|nr:GxxExxY protein [Chloroflexus sp.]
MSRCVNDQLGGLTYAIIGTAMAVHNELGPSHREAVYHQAMHQQLRTRGFASEYEPRLPVMDQHGNLVTVYTGPITALTTCYSWNTKRTATP